MNAGPSTVTTIGLIILVASLPTALVAGALDMAMNTWPAWFFVPIVMLMIGACVAFAGAL